MSQVSRRRDFIFDNKRHIRRPIICKDRYKRISNVMENDTLLFQNWQIYLMSAPILSSQFSLISWK